ncbi:MAG: hypothetical protein A2203_14110 [Chromatiales bacterium RIFOXYA1_FULL_46_5]|nr:MAG: hypothetical protein A2203_14110 [Chromatiales bacterium RIFOXYA1_FULL_46_5]
MVMLGFLHCVVGVFFSISAIYVKIKSSRNLSKHLSYFGRTKMSKIAKKCIFALLVAELLDLMQIIKLRLK